MQKFNILPRKYVSNYFVHTFFCLRMNLEKLSYYLTCITDFEVLKDDKLLHIDWAFQSVYKLMEIKDFSLARCNVLFVLNCRDNWCQLVLHVFFSAPRLRVRSNHSSSQSVFYKSCSGMEDYRSECANEISDSTSCWRPCCTGRI